MCCFQQKHHITQSQVRLQTACFSSPESNIAEAKEIKNKKNSVANIASHNINLTRWSLAVLFFMKHRLIRHSSVSSTADIKRCGYDCECIAVIKTDLNIVCDHSSILCFLARLRLFVREDILFRLHVYLSCRQLASCWQMITAFIHNACDGEMCVYV